MDDEVQVIGRAAEEGVCLTWREDQSVAFTKLETASPTEFVIEGIQNDQAFRQTAVDPDAAFNRGSGAGRYTYTMKPNIAQQLRGEAVTQALQTIERRVNELGVAEPIIARQGAADQILVQLPGVTDVNRAKEIIRSTALLELKQVEQGPFPDEGSARQAYGGNVPPDVPALPVTAASKPAPRPRDSVASSAPRV